MFFDGEKWIFVLLTYGGKKKNNKKLSSHTFSESPGSDWSPRGTNARPYYTNTPLNENADKQVQFPKHRARITCVSPAVAETLKAQSAVVYKFKTFLDIYIVSRATRSGGRDLNAFDIVYGRCFCAESSGIRCCSWGTAVYCCEDGVEIEKKRVYIRRKITTWIELNRVWRARRVFFLWRRARVLQDIRPSICFRVSEGSAVVARLQ